MKRIGWFGGKKVRRKCDVNYCHQQNVHEFEFGNFCKKHFEKLPSCSNPDCDNPAVPGTYNPDGLCRTCLFNYEPQLEIYSQSAIVDAQLWAIGKWTTAGIGKQLTAAMKRNGIRGPEPKLNWFFPSRNTEDI